MYNFAFSPLSPQNQNVPFQSQISDGMRKPKLSQTVSKLLPQARKEQITKLHKPGHGTPVRMVTRKGQILQSAVAQSAQGTFDVGLPVAEHNGRSGRMWGGRAQFEDETNSVD